MLPFYYSLSRDGFTREVDVIQRGSIRPQVDYTLFRSLTSPDISSIYICRPR